VSPRTHRDQATAYCSIGFQPVSGRAARHPRNSVIHGTGTRLEGPFDALSLAQGIGIFTRTERQAGSLSMLQYAVSWSPGGFVETASGQSPDLA
jgi:hypothetical protein